MDSTLNSTTEHQLRYLKAKILYDHLNQISLIKGVSEEASLGLAFASSSILLEPPTATLEEPELISFGGLSANDLIRYGPQRSKLSLQAKSALSGALKNTLDEVTLYYRGGSKDDNSYSLADDVEAEVSRTESDSRHLSSKAENLVSLYQQCTETHSKLNDTIKTAMDTLPPIANASHSACQEFLATTIEASLLKLSVVRARLKSSLYGYVSSNSRISVAESVKRIHDKLSTQQAVLEKQERDLQGRLMEYQRLIDMVDAGKKTGSFSQIVEDLTTVQRETEECRRDLRRLGWTEG